VAGSSKDSLTVGIGAGGLLALYVSFRRQMVSERDHNLQSGVAKNNQHDATEKRVTELYGKAVDQLANNSPAARLAALYALERLAQTNKPYRQTIVDLICGYLRIRRDVPKPDSPLEADATAGADASSAPGRDEAEVRATAQKILKAHLNKDDALNEAQEFWPDTRLDLHGARLEDFSLRECQLGYVDFRNAEFVGEADFVSARFKDEVDFDGAVFRGKATFGAAKFSKYASFEGIECCARTSFENATFEKHGSFEESTFRETFIADGMEVDSDIGFDSSEFFGNVYIRRANFIHAAVFDNCMFHDGLQMTNTKAGYKIKMIGCSFDAYIDLGEDAKFDMVLSRISKKADAIFVCAPPGWYVKEDVPGDFAEFRTPEMDELDKRRKETRGENGSAKPRPRTGTRTMVK